MVQQHDTELVKISLPANTPPAPIIDLGTKSSSYGQSLNVTNTQISQIMGSLLSAMMVFIVQSFLAQAYLRDTVGLVPDHCTGRR